MHHLTDGRGHIENLIQDLILELFGGREFAMELDRVTNNFRFPHTNRPTVSRMLTSFDIDHESSRLRPHTDRPMYSTELPARPTMLNQESAPTAVNEFVTEYRCITVDCLLQGTRTIDADNNDRCRVCNHTFTSCTFLRCVKQIGLSL